MIVTVAGNVAAAELLCACLALGYVTTETECAMGVSSEVRVCCLTAGYHLSIHLKQLSCCEDAGSEFILNVETFNRHTMNKRTKRPIFDQEVPC